MTLSRIETARQIAARHNFDIHDALWLGGNYVPTTEYRGIVHISGQVPRIGQTIVATGRVGEGVSLQDAQKAAEICALRAIAILQQSYGLDRIERVLKLNAFIQSAAGFTQHSEVADAASDLLAQVFATAGTHARTSVGVYRLPKNAVVELDLTIGLTNE